MSARIAFRLMGQRRFLPIWAAQTLLAFNDNLFRYALVTLAAYEGLTLWGLEPDILTPIAATAFTLPIFLFSAVAGQVADKYDRTKIMVHAKFAEIVLMTVAAAGFLLEQPLLLIVTLFLMGTQSAFFIPARNAALPTLLSDAELVPANALISGALNVAILAGAIGGTLLAGERHGPAVIAVTLIVVAVAGWLSMRPGAPAAPDSPQTRINWNIVTATWTMLDGLFKAPKVLRPLLGVAWFWMLGATVITVLPLFTRQVLGADESVVAFFQLLFTVGAALGALACGLLSRNSEGLVFVLLGAIGLVVFPVDLVIYTAGYARTEDLVSALAFIEDERNWRITADLTLSAVSAGMFVVPMHAMAQKRADPARRGRLLAASGILNGASASLGQFVLYGLGVFDLPLSGAFLVVAAGSLGGVAYAAWRILRNGNSS
ncbi:MFS transporter [Marinicauda algicola]|uniref:MFS transporter n=1 Tax=Marinicauda algicola TaxID=2029849 RepID=A0A4S2H2L7_9PROT|nr:MFS transporter [Marinicauda algicola]TGY89850.1 MFS transporter [Marinicauda algicola]